jgi:hypothetical protein
VIVLEIVGGILAWTAAAFTLGFYIGKKNKK